MWMQPAAPAITLEAALQQPPAVCTPLPACWKKSFVAFVLEQIRKSLFHIWINTSFEDLWKISLSVTPEGQSPVRGHFPQTPKAIHATDLNVGFKAVNGLATGLLWKRAFSSSRIAGHVSFCTNKYSVVKKKDPVVLQQCCNDAQLSFSEHKYAHKTKRLQNQVLGGLPATGYMANHISGFSYPRCSCRFGDAAVVLDFLLRLWLGSPPRANARAHVSIWAAQSLFDSAIVRSLLATH